MKRYFILGGVLIIILLLQVYLKDSFNFISYIFNKPIELVIAKTNEFKSYSSLYKDIQKNKEDIIASKRIMLENVNLKEQLKELTSILDIKTNNYEYEVINAAIISRSTNNKINTLNINKGSKNGIKNGFAVITNSCLIGKVLEVSNYSSKVELINSNMKISIKVIGKDIYYGVLGYKDGFYIEGIEEENLVGSKVLTSGLTEVFPSGILIGKIVNMRKDHFDLSTIYDVELACDLNKINYVAVLKRSSDDNSITN